MNYTDGFDCDASEVSERERLGDDDEAREGGGGWSTPGHHQQQTREGQPCQTGKQFFRIVQKPIVFVKSRNRRSTREGAYRKGSNNTFHYRLMSRHTAYCERTGDEGMTLIVVRMTRKTSEKTAHVDNFWDALCSGTTVPGPRKPPAKESNFSVPLRHTTHTAPGVALFLH